MQTSLFDDEMMNEPLANRLRPNTLSDYIGQKHILEEGKVLLRLIESDRLPSMIFGDRRVSEKRHWHELLRIKVKRILLISVR